MNKIIIGSVAAGLLILGVGACGSDQHQLDDAKVGTVDDKTQFVMTNLDGFPNVAFRCFAGPDVAAGGQQNGIYTTTRTADMLKIVVNDPQCPGYDSTKPTVGIP